MRKKAIAVLGIVGLGVAGGSVSASAAPSTSPPGVTICHANEAGTYEPFLVSVHGLVLDLNGHKGHVNDIIPIRGYDGDPNGQNMTPENVAILNHGCVGAVAGPAVPVSPSLAVDAPAAAPRDATVLAPPAGALNLGYNVDGVVQVESGDVIPFWLAVTTGLLAAVAALVAWRARARARNGVG
jgi:hypothetical protein